MDTVMSCRLNASKMNCKLIFKRDEFSNRTRMGVGCSELSYWVTETETDRGIIGFAGWWRSGGLPPGVADSVPGVILHDPDDGTVHAVHNRAHVPQPSPLGLRREDGSHRIGSLPPHAPIQVNISPANGIDCLFVICGCCNSRRLADSISSFLAKRSS